MRIRSYCIIAILFCGFAFSGCFEIYYDIVQNTDDTFLIRQTVGLSNTFFEGIADLSNLGGGDSTKFSRQMIIDSIRHTFALRRDSLTQIHHLIGMNGISAFSVRDTTIDTMTYFSFESTVANADSLPGAFRLMSNMSEVMRPSNEEEDTEDVRLFVNRTKSKTTLMFKAPQKAEGFMSIDIPGLTENFKNISMHYRVFSAALEWPAGKQIKQIPGGQERVFGLSDLLKKGRQSHLDATFAIKNIALTH
ncbi:MAG TPA: hypothetical protein VG537_00500 [Candidatus Kapabacteria bacterium]|jgi:hypothetical protein|nr:hypothetical protein [Candidatus Kapabacteria bacterium]